MGLKKFIINLAPIPLVKLFANPYVAGDSIDAATDTAQNFWEKRHVCSTIDLLGEELDSDEEVQYTVNVYERLIQALGSHEFATISLKPTQLGSHRGTECTEKEYVEQADHGMCPLGSVEWMNPSGDPRYLRISLSLLLPFSRLVPYSNAAPWNMSSYLRKSALRQLQIYFCFSS